jgi:hypothetical protein
MSYTVLSSTIEEVASGAAFLPIRLADRLTQRLWELGQARRPARETCEVEIYFLNSFLNREAFHVLKERFGGDPMQFLFLNECAVRAFEHFNIAIDPIGTVEELPAGVGVSVRHMLAVV